MGSKTAASGGQAGGQNAGGQTGGDVSAFPMPQTQYPTQNTNMPDMSNIYGGFGGLGGMLGGGRGWQPPFPPMQPTSQPSNGMPQIQPDGVWGGTNGPHHMSDDDYLRMMYQTQLGREGDQGGMDYWRGQLGSGAVDRNQLMQNFRNSAEGQGYQQRIRPMMDDFGGGYGMGQQQMSQEVLDAMRLAYEQNRPQRTYTPEEWSSTFGPNVDPDPRMIRQNPAGQQGQMSPNVSQALALLGRLFG